MSHTKRKDETYEEYLARRRDEYYSVPNEERHRRRNETHEEYLARRRAEYQAKPIQERRKQFTRIVTDEQREARRLAAARYNKKRRKDRATQRAKTKAEIVNANIKWLAMGGCLEIGELLRPDDPPLVGTKIIIALYDGILTQHDISRQTKHFKRNYLPERA